MAKSVRISDGALLKDGDPERLVVLFSSLAAPALLEFDYMQYYPTLDQTVLLLRDDTSETGYHAGIAGLSESIDDTADAIRELAAKIGAKSIVTAGTSQGGYAAALIGYMIDADHVVSMNGFSFCSEALTESYGGGERADGDFALLREFYEKKGEDPQYLDLVDVAKAHPDSQMRLRWHYGLSDPHDVIHAKHMAQIPSTELIPHKGIRKHGRLVLRMMMSGDLDRELAGEFDDA